MVNIFKILITLIFFNIPLFSHCQMPCGIYYDALQIIQIQEDLKTIEKSMDMLKSYSGKSDPQTLNQIGRWINSKESHAQNIQKIISEYFLTQRIKIESKNYTKKISTLHKLLISTMKCKQTVDKSNVLKSKSLLETFVNLYLDKHGIEHLKKLELKQ